MRVAPLVAILVAACAAAPPPPPPPAPVAPPVDLPRSSIAAVLLHREELGLTETQVEALQRRDDELAREDAALRARVAKSDPSTSASGVAPPPASGGSSGRGGRRPHQGAPGAARRPVDPLTRLDDNDTRAYLEVEERLLTEAQRPRAQEIASRYREALYDQQHRSR